jgi:hypothetical protein
MNECIAVRGSRVFNAVSITSNIITYLALIIIDNSFNIRVKKFVVSYLRRWECNNMWCTMVGEIDKHMIVWPTERKNER